MSSITAILCFAGAILLLAFGDQAAGILWIALGLVWTGVAIGRGKTDHPVRLSRLLRRFSRMLLYWS